LLGLFKYFVFVEKKNEDDAITTSQSSSMAFLAKKKHRVLFLDETLHA